MKSVNDTILWNQESDRYTERAQRLHEDGLHSAPSDLADAATLAALLPVAPKHILDIGCAYGGFTGALAGQFPRAKVVGIDPGRQSIELAKQSLRGVRNASFQVGYSHELGVDGPFDLIVLRMVMQWIPRQHLLQTIAEIDRVCSGFVFIQDFYPRAPITSVSKHNKDVRIFKQDYAQIFTSLPTYKLVHKRVLDAAYGDDYRWGRFLLAKQPLATAYEIRKGVQQKNKTRRRR